MPLRAPVFAYPWNGELTLSSETHTHTSTLDAQARSRGQDAGFSVGATPVGQFVQPGLTSPDVLELGPTAGAAFPVGRGSDASAQTSADAHTHTRSIAGPPAPARRGSDPAISASATPLQSPTVSGRGGDAGLPPLPPPNGRKHSISSLNAPLCVSANVGGKPAQAAVGGATEGGSVGDREGAAVMGEVRSGEPALGSASAASMPAAASLPVPRASVFEGTRCCTHVLVKRIPKHLTDGASIDFNIQLSAAMENERRLHSGMIHLLQTLTCHHSRPGDDADQPYYYVALEHCDFNLQKAVELTRGFLRGLSTLTRLSHFDEDGAPLLLWRARRSVARQLLSGIAFLHRTGIGMWQRIYHNNLHPKNVLLKNGIVKLSEINCYSYSDAYIALKRGVVNAGASMGTPAVGARSPVSSAAGVADDLSAPRVVTADAVLPAAAQCEDPVLLQEVQREFVPRISLSCVEEITMLHARVAEALAAAATSSPSNGAESPSSQEVSVLVSDDTQADMARLYRLRSYRDSFAVGCLIYYALTLGKHPFGTLSSAQRTGTAAARIASGSRHNSKDISVALASAATAATQAANTVAAALRASEDEREVARAQLSASSPPSPILTAVASADVSARVQPPDAGSSATIPQPQSATGVDTSTGEGAGRPHVTIHRVHEGHRLAAVPVVYTDQPPLRTPAEPRASHTDAGDVAIQVDLRSNAGRARHASFRSALLAGVPPLSADSPPADSPHSVGGSTRREPPWFHQHYTTATDTMDHEEATDLVCSLIDPDPASRILPADALAHPFFWSTARKFLLITLASEGTVVQQDRAVGRHADFAAEIQRSFLARLPPGATQWGPLFPAPPGCGADGWHSRLWPHRDPRAYEDVYAGPYSMYSLIRFTRNLWVHGPEHVRLGLFTSHAALEAHILSAFPWLVLEIWRADQKLGGFFTRQTLAGGSTQAVVADAGVDADYDVVPSNDGPQAAPSSAELATESRNQAADAAIAAAMGIVDDDGSPPTPPQRNGARSPRPHIARQEAPIAHGEPAPAASYEHHSHASYSRSRSAMPVHRGRHGFRYDADDYDAVPAYYPSDDEHLGRYRGGRGRSPRPYRGRPGAGNRQRYDGPS